MPVPKGLERCPNYAFEENSSKTQLNSLWALESSEQRTKKRKFEDCGLLSLPREQPKSQELGEARTPKKMHEG